MQDSAKPFSDFHGVWARVQQDLALLPSSNGRGSCLHQVFPLHVRLHDDKPTAVIGLRDHRLPSETLHEIMSAIRDSYRRIFDADVDVHFQICDRRSPDSSALQGPGYPTFLDPSLTFARYIVSSANRDMVHSLQQIAENPANRMVILCGDTGTGKTHLMHATMHAMIHHRADLRIAYFPLAEWHSYLRTGHGATKPELAMLNQELDVLVLDDFHYLAHMPASIQNHVQNSVQQRVQNGNTVFVSSDAGAGPVDQILARYSNFPGLIRIAMPVIDEAVSTAYAERVMEELSGVYMPDSNHREETKTIGNFKELRARLVDVAQPGSASPPMMKPLHAAHSSKTSHVNKAFISLDTILAAVSEHFAVPQAYIKSPSRKSEYILPRHVCMYLAVQLTGLKKSAVARFFGKSDHTTVINAERRILSLMQKKGYIKETVNELTAALSNGSRSAPGN